MAYQNLRKPAIKNSSRSADNATVIKTIRNFIQAALFLISVIVSGETVDQFLSSQNKIRGDMLDMSRQLGVTCLTCHDPNNFADKSKQEYQTAANHMRVTQTLIDLGMDGKEKHPKATCYMCHRGELMPQYTLPKDPLLWPASPKKVDESEGAP